MEPKIEIETKIISYNDPTYFIADIAANHDGNFERAIKLINLAKEAGADAAKFQNFIAPKIVSDFGFKSLKERQAHQANWKKSVLDVYSEASISREWTKKLKAECDKAGIHYFSSPYDFESVDHIDPYVSVYKIGSGDITWLEILEYIAKKNKPILLATGASDISDVKRAVATILPINKKLAIMQCNTNYTASIDNYKYIQLRVLETYKKLFPDHVLGLSDHTQTLATTLGAVCLGARIIEKHFTDDNFRDGPDHKFAMNPKTWREMVDRTRELERALGNGQKKVEENEKESIVVQQRSIRAAREIAPGEIITRNDVEILRPCPSDGIKPYDLKNIIGAKAEKKILMGDIIRWDDIGR